MVGETGGPRLLIYSQDGLGLGHLRRTTLLASAFLAARPTASVLTVSDSPVGQFFSTATGHDYLKLPTIRKAGPGDWHPVSLAMPFADVLRLRREMIRVAVDGFCPDVLLVDHMPHGAMGELVPALEALRHRPVRTVLGLRDIVDAPSTVRRRWQVEGAFEAVREHFDDVLVYGSKDVFDVAAQYDWSADIGSRLRYCGYVCAPATAGHEAVRRHCLRDAPQDSDLVVAMAGGGADAYSFFEPLVRAVRALVRERRCVVVVVTGPFLPEDQRAGLHRLAEDLPVRVVTTVDDPVSYIGAADLVVAMAGYNTTAEILRSASRALLVPREGPSAEQRMRASRFAARGWVRWLPPELVSPPRLAATMVDALASPVPVASRAPDLHGREQAVRHLLAGHAEPMASRPIDPVVISIDPNDQPAAVEPLLSESQP